jgi:hypothetical protein
MANPFSDLINDDFKLTFKYAIQAVIDGFAIPCKIVYPYTKYEACDCVGSDIGNTSSNRHITGAPVPFHGISTCPVCDGTGKRPVETSENVSLAVIFDYKQFLKIADVQIPTGAIQILSNKSMLPKLKKCRQLILDTDNQALVKQVVTLYGEPTPMGFDKEFILSIWIRS